MPRTSSDEDVFRRIRSEVGLELAIREDRGQANRSGRYLCPFHQDTNPDLGIEPGGMGYKCWSCGSTGDVITWLGKHRGWGRPIDVARRLEYFEGGARPRSESKPVTRKPRMVHEKPAVEVAEAWREPDWQAEVDRLICEAHHILTRTVFGRAPLRYLKSRGIHEGLIYRFRLGFVHDKWTSKPLRVLTKNGEPQSIYVPRGVIIPYAAPGHGYLEPKPTPVGEERHPDDDEPETLGNCWLGANVRRRSADVFAPLPANVKKYRAIDGTSRGYPYPWPNFETTQEIRVDQSKPGAGPPALIVEGEFDAMKAEDEVGHLGFVTTIGGASQRIRPEAMVVLNRCPYWLVAIDNDAAGHLAANSWLREGGRRFRRVNLPLGKDISDFVVAGGDVQAWLRSEGERIMREMRS